MKSLAKFFGVGAIVLPILSTTESLGQTTNNFYIEPIEYYQTARAYEDAFNVHKDTADASKSLENFEKYYVSAPDGALACNALIRKSLLLHKIGRDSSAQLELDRMKSLSKCKEFYSGITKYVEKLIKRNGKVKKVSTQ